jgi:hypothetical protein
MSIDKDELIRTVSRLSASEIAQILIENPDLAKQVSNTNKRFPCDPSLKRRYNR